jgi:thiamine pyrophosphate-dependent acetolactate synthase large subunit-like protein
MLGPAEIFTIFFITLGPLKILGPFTCFANPGTSEMELVYEMGGTKDTRAVLGLGENVVTGAADGYTNHGKARRHC